MTDKETYCSEELERCRANIEKTKGKIEFHKDMLKKLEHKEMELLSKLEKIKLDDLKSLINTRGYDIDDLRAAMKAGDFSGVVPQKSEEKEPEQSGKTSASEAVQQEDNVLLADDTNPPKSTESAETADINQPSETDNNN